MASASDAQAEAPRPEDVTFMAIVTRIRPSGRVIAATGSALAFAALLALTIEKLSANSGAVSGFDLDHCEDKPTYRVDRCGPGSAVACWSASAGTNWACWLQGEAPGWAATALDANVRCRTWTAGGPFDGACTLLVPAAVPGPPPPVPEPLPWEMAYSQARATLGQMRPQEKMTLLRGIGWSGLNLQKWWYVGNTAAIPRLGIPSLNMQDAAGGFRTYWNELIGTVTCWPSLLALASTWDASAVQALGVALGEEFAGKGANGILGPSVDVHRVARGGRNFEFLSGEDPYLGARLARAYVRGVQSKGVFAVMKHWAFNSQETNRDTENSIVDDKTAWELYYPPFEAAVNAGVSAAMCSYNQVDGEYACSSHKQLQTVLKQRMGFRGFVQSDWWASHATTVPQGLDQEMPSTDPARYYSPQSLAMLPAEAVDEAATRVLAVMHRMNLTTSAGCTPPACRERFLRNVTGPAHAALAHALAKESIVLLKNKDGVLPLSPRSVHRVAVIGAAAVAGAYNPNGGDQGAKGWSHGDYYSGGGSGHVVAGRLVTPLQGIMQRASAAGIGVIPSVTDDIDSAVEAASGADVAVVVAGETSGESKDRESLSLDDDTDSLIMAVASQTKRTIVLVQAPGAVLMPWRDAVSAVLVLFLGGQETGSAWADVLFGDHAPTGRLPITIPATEDDAVAPSKAATVAYKEGMATGYRNRGFTYAYPFGHGLTYASFDYETLRSVPCQMQGMALCIAAPLKNNGFRAARTVAQLYVELPPEAGHPSPMLKGFQKTGVLLAGHSVEVVFPLTRRDLSYYDVGTAGWKEASPATAHVGESSADIRQSLKLLKGQSGAWVAGAASSRTAAKSNAHAANPVRCSTSDLTVDCRMTQCCAEPGMQCYRKNPWWATCRATCTPGEINHLEKKQYQTPWDCRPLGARAKEAGADKERDRRKALEHKPPVRLEPKQGEVVIRVKVAEVPHAWARGASVTLTGDHGEQLRGEVVPGVSGHGGGGGEPAPTGPTGLDWVGVGLLLLLATLLSVAAAVVWAWRHSGAAGEGEGLLQWFLDRTSEALSRWEALVVREVAASPQDAGSGAAAGPAAAPPQHAPKQAPGGYATRGSPSRLPLIDCP